MTAPEWFPIQTAPKDGTEILLLYHSEFIRGLGYWVENDKYAYWSVKGNAVFPSRWAPIPKMPGDSVDNLPPEVLALERQFQEIVHDMRERNIHLDPVFIEKLKALNTGEPSCGKETNSAPSIPV